MDTNPDSLEAVVFIPYVDACQIMVSKRFMSLKALIWSCLSYGTAAAGILLCLSPMVHDFMVPIKL